MLVSKGRVIGNEKGEKGLRLRCVQCALVIRQVAITLLGLVRVNRVLTVP